MSIENEILPEDTKWYIAGDITLGIIIKDYKLD